MSDITSKTSCNCPNSSYGQKHTKECYEATIERLTRELANEREGSRRLIGDFHTASDVLREYEGEIWQQAQAVIADRDRLRGALEWYAGFGDEAHGYDMGRKAREALEGIHHETRSPTVIDGLEHLLKAEDSKPVHIWPDGSVHDDPPPERGAHQDAREDRAYCDGARQAHGIAHQSLVALDEWIAGGCGGRWEAAQAEIHGQETNGEQS